MGMYQALEPWGGQVGGPKRTRLGVVPERV